MLEKGEQSYAKLASRKCDHNKSLYPCASVVATVVRMPRSEVSERHRAGKLGVGVGTFVDLDPVPPQGGGIGGRRMRTLALVRTEGPQV